MKKSRTLAAVLVAAMISMGAGYAAWTDTVKINNTVSTGNLDVDFVGQAVVYQEGNQNVAIGKATASENEATITLTNVYPGAEATVTLPVQNNGTIPVKNGEFKFTGVPEWLTVKATSQPVLAVNEKKDVIITMTVGDNAPQTKTATFVAEAIYNQFNK